LTPISFIRGRPAGPDPDEADASGGFILACVVLAVLILLLCLTVFLTVRGGSLSRRGPGAVAVRARIEAEPSAPAPQLAPAPAPAPAPSAPAPAPAPARALAPAYSAPAPDRRARMLAALRSAKGVITLAVQDDPAAEASGRRLMNLFQDAGWTVRWNSVFGAGPPLRGLSAALGAGAQDAAVRRAFADAGVGLGPPPTSGIVQTPEIFVGAAEAKPTRR
jgi:pyruvate/2-oxoglutarate dehydrogenase complex dihydrolipoamide acyltransferase (E2) component